MSETQGGVPVCYRHPSREAHIRCQRCDRPICPECMTPASVGFQCPECLREGQKSVRQPRSITLGGGGAVVTWTLIGINVAVFLLVHVAPGWFIYDLMLHGGTVCVEVSGGVCTHSSRGVADGAYWQLLTNIFTHQALLHIGSNMLSLFMIGPMLEAALGRVRYLVTYLLCGLAGSALVYGTTAVNAPTLGASGAIFGLLGVLFVLFLRRGLPMQQLLVVLALNFYVTFSYSGISWQAHVGGFVTGLVIGAILEFTRGVRRGQRLRLAGFGAVMAAIVVAVITRSLTL